MENPLLIRNLNGEERTFTGSLFLRDSGMGGLPKGKKMMMVMGVILVDEKDFPFKGEHQVQVAGYNGKDNAEMVMVNPKHLPDVEYMGADQIFCQPIWRV